VPDIPAEAEDSSDQRTTTEILLLDGRNTIIGRLRYRTCRRCRTGRILDVWVLDAWQRQGLGSDLVRVLLTRCPGVRWTTTVQTRTGRLFFTAMTEETSVSFPQREPPCAHLAGRFIRGWRRAISWWRLR
jgi:hypothetical protein